MKRAMLITVLFALLSPLAVRAQPESSIPITLTWDQQMDHTLTGWRFYVYDAPGEYTPDDYYAFLVYTGETSEELLEGLTFAFSYSGPEGTEEELFFTIAVYDHSGNMCFSNEISCTVTFPDTTPPACPVLRTVTQN